MGDPSSIRDACKRLRASAESSGEIRTLASAVEDAFEWLDAYYRDFQSMSADLHKLSDRLAQVERQLSGLNPG